MCVDLKEGLQHWGPRGPNFFHWGPKWDLKSIQSYTHDPGFSVKVILETLSLVRTQNRSFIIGRTYTYLQKETEA